MNIPFDRFACPGAWCYSVADAPDRLCKECWAFRPVIHDGLRLLWRLAPSALLPTVQSVSAKVSTSAPKPGSRSPLRDAVLDAQEFTFVTVRRWAVTLHEQAQRPAPAPIDFAECVEFLSDVDYLLADRIDEVNYYNDLFKCHRQLHRVIRGVGSDVERVAGECCICGSLALCAREHRDQFICLSCGSVWGQASWHFRLAGRITGSPILSFTPNMKGEA